MRAGTFAICLWPGLPQLWLRGKWSGLGLALGFAFMLDLLLLATFLTPPLIPIWGTALAWILLSVAWGRCSLSAYRQQTSEIPPAEEALRGLFIRAQGEYLRGNWAEAESQIRQLLGLSETDVDAQMLLASILRRTGRLREARECLRRLEKMDGGPEKWRWEIAQEYRILDQSKN